MSETTLNIVSTGYLQYMEADVTILIEKLRRGRRGRRKRGGGGSLARSVLPSRVSTERNQNTRGRAGARKVPIHCR